MIREVINNYNNVRFSFKRLVSEFLEFRDFDSFEIVDSFEGKFQFLKKTDKEYKYAVKVFLRSFCDFLKEKDIKAFYRKQYSGWSISIKKGRRKINLCFSEDYFHLGDYYKIIEIQDEDCIKKLLEFGGLYGDFK